MAADITAPVPSDAAPTPAKPPKKPKSAPKTAAKRPGKPSKKPVPKDINRSAEIRKVASGMKAKGIKPRPSVIAAELGAKGITVTPTLVSLVLKGMGFRPLRRRKKSAGNSSVTIKTAAAKRSTGSSPISVDELVAAKKAVTVIGGSERAIEAITALRRLEN